MKKFNYLYKISNLVNGKYYIGSKAEKINTVWKVKTVAFCD